MRSVRTAPVIGLIAQLTVLGAIAEIVGLNGFGWLIGVTCGVTTAAALTRGFFRPNAEAFGPADWVTLIRATLAGGVAALIADSFSRTGNLQALVGLAVIALVLDAVDGWVARRTETVSKLGARFDLEVDAFLILVLSINVARSMGAWVLAIGLARYAFVAAGWLLPWLHGQPPARFWCKVVAATQGVVLTLAMANVLPRMLAQAALLASLALLVESFGREVSWLWRNRRSGEHLVAVPSPARAAAAGVITVLAGALVWFALVAPDEISHLTLGAFVRLPLEGLVVVPLVLILPSRVRPFVAALVGMILALLTIVKILDMGFIDQLDRPFNPVTDWGNFAPAVGVLTDSIGRNGAIAFVIGAVVLAVAILVLMPLSVMRLTRLMGRHRAGSVRTVTTLGIVWVLCAVFGAQIVPGAPIASTSAADLAYNQVLEVDTAIHDPQVFSRLSAVDAFRNTPGTQLLTGLRGKDVLVTFVESYGRVAVQDSAFSPQVDATLNAGTKRLRAAGFASASAFLTSPTFGGISWLAHSTLQSGLWVNSQQRYDELVSSNRFTLSDAFKRAGWRTVGDVPSNRRDWPEGKSFYHYDQVYDERNVGYAGPKFSYAAMPDQYTLAALQGLELAKPHHTPVMAEIDLVSSHTPWAPLPHMVSWSTIGDGSVFDGMPAEGESPDVVWRDSDQVRAAYGQSIRYSMNALVSFVQHFDDKNLVLVVLGDHQPATIVSGDGASHDVPISIIAHDPAVMDRISGWGWQNGLLPHPKAPVWPMDDFRDRFLTAYGPPPRG